MVEVFKTNVENQDHAKMLVEQIHMRCADYEAHFDLEDCDRILRVKSKTGSIASPSLIDILKDFGYDAEVLPD